MTSRNGRSGFTLVEMLVVVTIVLILTVMTVSAVNLAFETDRVRAGARQVQSYLAGARDRAIYAREPRGVRFILDSSADGPSQAVRSMVYVQPVDPWRLSIKDLTNNTPGDETTALDRFVVDSSSGGNQTATDYLGLFDLIEKGLLLKGSNIRVPQAGKTGRIYQIRQVHLPTDKFNYLDGIYGSGGAKDQNFLTFVYENTSADYPDDEIFYTTLEFQGSERVGGLEALLELPPVPLPNEEPVQLPRGIVISLNGSTDQFTGSATPTAGAAIPNYWKIPLPPPGGGFVYHNRMDVMFSPLGTVTGPVAATGLVHMLLTEQVYADVQMPADAPLRLNSTPYSAGDWVKIDTAGSKYARCTTTGPSNSGGSPPTDWPDRDGQTVSDGSVVWEVYIPEERLIVSLFTRTGAVSTHPVFVDPTGGVDVDPFRFAETGQVAAK